VGWEPHFVESHLLCACVHVGRQLVFPILAKQPGSQCGGNVNREQECWRVVGRVGACIEQRAGATRERIPSSLTHWASDGQQGENEKG